MVKKSRNLFVKAILLGCFVGWMGIHLSLAEEPELPVPALQVEEDQFSLLDFEPTECRAQVPTSSRSLEVRKRLWGTSAQPGSLRQAVVSHGFLPGNPVYFRIFKQTQGPVKGVTAKDQGQLEVWMLPKGAHEYKLFKTYPIVAWGGGLGPKLKEGDGQSPEGFYSFDAEALNPLSQFHLSMNLGFPNVYDQNFGRTGSFVMIHGGDQSGGCFVFSFPDDEELYVLAEAALMKCAGEVPVAVFPFPLTEENLKASSEHRWSSFWENLAEGYRIFERLGQPPKVSVSQGRYQFREP